jgi:hypothetical protein
MNSPNNAGYQRSIVAAIGMSQPGGRDRGLIAVAARQKKVYRVTVFAYGTFMFGPNTKRTWNRKPFDGVCWACAC